MDKNKKTYKSHVLLIKKLIKPYQIKTEDGKKVKYLDLNTMSIKEEKINNLDSVEKYFDVGMEEYLDKIVESPFSETIINIEKFIKDNKNNISIKDLNNIRRFFQFSLLRNKEVYKRIFDNSVFAPITSGFSHSFVLSFASSVSEMFKDKKISILLNKNKNGCGFVCPHNVIYYLFNSVDNEYNLAITINKKIMVCFNLKSLSNHVDIIEVYKELDIRAINCGIYNIEKQHSESYIVGAEEDLKRLKDDIGIIQQNKNNKIIVKLK